MGAAVHVALQTAGGCEVAPAVPGQSRAAEEAPGQGAAAVQDQETPAAD